MVSVTKLITKDLYEHNKGRVSGFADRLVVVLPYIFITDIGK